MAGNGEEKKRCKQKYKGERRFHIRVRMTRTSKNNLTEPVGTECLFYSTETELKSLAPRSALDHTAEHLLCNTSFLQTSRSYKAWTQCNGIVRRSRSYLAMTV